MSVVTTRKRARADGPPDATDVAVGCASPARSTVVAAARTGAPGHFFVDRFDALTLAVIVTLLMLTIADGVLTIELLDTNSEEMNPIMARLIVHGQQAFLIGKYILTAAGLPFIVVYKNYPMFGTRFRIGFVLPIFVGLYIAPHFLSVKAPPDRSGVHAGIGVHFVAASGAKMTR